MTLYKLNAFEIYTFLAKYIDDSSCITPIIVQSNAL